MLSQAASVRFSLSDSLTASEGILDGLTHFDAAVSLRSKDLVQ